MLSSSDKFERDFKITFEDINRQHEAERKLLDLRQGHRVATIYISQFQHLSTELQWSGAVLVSVRNSPLRELILFCSCGTFLLMLC